MASIVAQLTPDIKGAPSNVEEKFETFNTGGFEIKVVQMPIQSRPAQIKQTPSNLANSETAPATTESPKERSIAELEAFFKKQSVITSAPVNLESLHPAHGSKTNNPPHSEQPNTDKLKVFTVATKKLANAA